MRRSSGGSSGVLVYGMRKTEGLTGQGEIGLVSSGSWSFPTPSNAEHRVRVELAVC